MKFKDWLIENSNAPAAKQTLYPPAYGAALYPTAAIMNWSADAFVYMPEKDRKYEFKYGKGILSKKFDDSSEK